MGGKGQNDRGRMDHPSRSRASRAGLLLSFPPFRRLPRRLAKFTGHEENHIFAIFVPVLTTLCILGYKVLERFCAFLRALIRFPSELW